jgi:hypothetical protein
MPSREAKDAAHDNQKHLNPISSKSALSVPGAGTYVELGVALRSGLEGLFASSSLALGGGTSPTAARNGAHAGGCAKGGAGDDGGHGGGETRAECYGVCWKES